MKKSESLYPELYYPLYLTDRRLPGSALGQTPVQCDNTKCWPVGKGYIDTKKIQKIDPKGEMGTKEHVEDHEETYYNDFVKYPYLMHGIQTVHQDLMRKYGPQVAIEIYEALTESRVIDKKKKSDRKMSGNWLKESGYRGWTRLVSLLRKNNDVDDILKFYNEIGEMRARALDSYRKGYVPTAGEYRRNPYGTCSGKGYCSRCGYN